MHTNFTEEIESTYTTADWLLDTAVIVTLAIGLTVLAFEYSGAADALLAWVEIM